MKVFSKEDYIVISELYILKGTYGMVSNLYINILQIVQATFPPSIVKFG